MDKAIKIFSSPPSAGLKFAAAAAGILLCPALAHSRITDYVNTMVGTSNFGTTNPGLTAYDIVAQVSATERTAIEKYTFPGGQGNILVNFGQGLTNETGAWIRRISETEIEGMRLAGTFCYNPQAVFPVYFAIRINRKPAKSGFWKKQPQMTGVEAEWTPDNGKYKIYEKYGREIAGDDIGYWFSFDTGEGGGSLRDRQLFYTALYHALIHPNIVNDVNGEYPLMENAGTGRVQPGHKRYTVFSLWDTYRAAMPLYSIFQTERYVNFIKTMVDICDEQGKLPVWHLHGCETDCMVGIFFKQEPVLAQTVRPFSRIHKRQGQQGQFPQGIQSFLFLPPG